ncbi:hypothetical protein DV736_g3559, partial [Chaetothyriales sp. CBS 134916]
MFLIALYLSRLVPVIALHQDKQDHNNNDLLNVHISSLDLSVIPAPWTAVKHASRTPFQGNNTKKRLAISQVPDETLNDAEINQAITLLPPSYSFEIHRTIYRIRTLKAKRVALQIPKGLLMFATAISDILTQFCPGTETLIMGNIATLYIFVDISIDMNYLAKTLARNISPGKAIAMVGTIQFNTALHSIGPVLEAEGLRLVVPPVAPLKKGEILGYTAPKSH